ncbi:hypothetical protein [Sphingobium aromaticivastans]|uniref:hypothetical protein n=1 Tax=Sphingobium aromaticivastans TaxID=1778665 RepID=UPI0030194245
MARPVRAEGSDRLANRPFLFKDFGAMLFERQIIVAEKCVHILISAVIPLFRNTRGIGKPMLEMDLSTCAVREQGRQECPSRRMVS